MLGGALAASTLSLLSGCGAVSRLNDGPGGGPGAAASGGPGNAALLLPLSGQSAELGQMLESAASLGGGPGIGITLIDSGSTPETAAAAARRATDAGARLIVGPVFGAQARAVAAAVPGGVPVVTLSNDASLAGRGLFVFGVTPAHSAQAALALAQQRNLPDMAVIVPPGPLGAQSIAAAQSIAPTLGIRLRAPIVTRDPAGIGAALAAGGGAPDAVYLPAADATLRPFARALAGQGIQLIGSTQWAALDLTGDPAFEEAWFAAPDPLRFAPFRQAYEEETGRAAGIIAGLAYDGTELCRLLARADRQSRRGLTREDGFSGVLGPYRFLRSGLCQRGLAVLKVGGGGISLIGATSV